jgi:hypothetical protein
MRKSLMLARLGLALAVPLGAKVDFSEAMEAYERAEAPEEPEARPAARPPKATTLEAASPGPACRRGTSAIARAAGAIPASTSSVVRPWPRGRSPSLRC